MKQQRIKDFVNTELRGAGRYFNERGLPHMMDGLKTGQRKIIEVARKIPAGQEIKVSSLGGRTVDIMAYHHGDAALQETIVRLAQDFPGTNNVPFMDALGAFGTAKKKEASAPRYIHTRLSKAFHVYFDARDQHIVEHLYDDGEKIEPKFLIPMIPTILVNGASGVATGYSSSIAQYDPKDIKRALLDLVKHGQITKPLQPWVKGFKGSIIKDPITKQIQWHGVLEAVHKTKLLITELPPQWNLLKYKEHLNGLVEKDIIKDYTNKSGAAEWKFEIQCTREFSDNTTHAKMMDLLGLIERDTENIVCWKVDGTVGVFDSVEDLLVEWYNQRLVLAGKSLANIIAGMEEELLWLRVKRLFVAWWKDNQDEVIRLGKKEISEKCLAEINLLAEHPKYLTQLLEIKLLTIAKDETEMLTRHIAEKTTEIATMRGFTPASWYQLNLEGIELA